MCNITAKAKLHVAKKNFFVFKRIRDGKSEVAVHARAALAGFPSQGRTLKYKPGTTVKSPSGPGIMAYIQSHAIRPYESHVVLLIEKGTKFRRGKHRGYSMIAAEKVTVVPVL